MERVTGLNITDTVIDIFHGLLGHIGITDIHSIDLVSLESIPLPTHIAIHLVYWTNNAACEQHQQNPFLCV